MSRGLGIVILLMFFLLFLTMATAEPDELTAASGPALGHMVPPQMGDRLSPAAMGLWHALTALLARADGDPGALGGAG